MLLLRTNKIFRNNIDYPILGQYWEGGSQCLANIHYTLVIQLIQYWGGGISDQYSPYIGYPKWRGGVVWIYIGYSILRRGRKGGIMSG